MKRLSKKQNKRRMSFRQLFPTTPVLESLEGRRLLTINGIAVEPPVDIDSTDHAVVEETSSNSEMYGPEYGQEKVLRVVNGTQTNKFASVGIVNDGCTGTLIAPNAVLTAAHCVEPGGSATFVLDGKIHTAAGSNVHVHPDYQSDDIDLAIIILDSPVQGVTPSEINRTPPTVGQMLTLVGYGATGNGTTGHNGDFGVKHQGQTPLDTLTQNQLIWNFDNNNEANTAPGDSGGPAYIEQDGKLVIAGITSGGEKADASIGDVSFDTRVDTHASWIDSILQSNGNDSTPDQNPDDGSNDDVDDTNNDDLDPPVDDNPGDDLGDDDFVDDDFMDDDLGGDDYGDDDFIDDDFGGDFDAEQLATDELALYDQNNDGMLSNEELVAEFVDFGESSGDALEIAEDLIAEFDTDNDSKLNLAELIESYGGIGGAADQDLGDDFGTDDDWTDDWGCDDGCDDGFDDSANNGSSDDWFSEDDFGDVDSFFGSYEYDFWG